MSVILASASPRRSELLSMTGLKFQVQPVNIDEIAAEEAAKSEIAGERALSVARVKADAIDTEDVLMSADTVVVVEGVSLGKPLDSADAARMLQLLAGRDHFVATGIVIRKGEQRWESSVTATVRMRPYDAQLVSRYVASEEPLDKAGGYAIQNLGGQLIESIDGCYLSIVGFPLCAVVSMLQDAGIHISNDPVAFCREAAQRIAGSGKSLADAHPGPARIRRIGKDGERRD